MIQVKHLSFGYPMRPILQDSSCLITSGSKVGLVGPNGAGKTTLLKILGGQEEPETGAIDIVGTLGLVPQEVKYDTILEQSTNIRNYIDPDTKKRDDELQRLLEGMEVGDLSLDRSPQNLSGGQKTKLAFLRNIILEPDILLLDEPTNFLDIPAKRWVMNFLSRYPKTLLIVSHDIALLDAQLSKVLYVNTHTHKIEEYTGNYSKFLKLQKEREEFLKRQRASGEGQIRRMKKGLAKIQGSQSEKGVRAKINLQNRIERAKDNLPELPPVMRGMRFTLPEPNNVGRIALEVQRMSKSYDKRPILKNISFMVERGQKVALIGRNGAGKSTLLKGIMGELEPDSGKVIRHELLDIGYYAQEHESFDLRHTLVEAVIEHQPKYIESQARALLGRFMFSGDRAYQRISTLSGGEKTRLAIALLVVKNHNLLILDEPTTYLDILSQRIILEVLKDYKGAMLLVSHTEEFVKELAPDRALILPDGLYDFFSPELLDRVSST